MLGKKVIEMAAFVFRRQRPNRLINGRFVPLDYLERECRVVQPKEGLEACIDANSMVEEFTCKWDFIRLISGRIDGGCL